jgi:hypothetical protein
MTWPNRSEPPRSTLAVLPHELRLGQHLMSKPPSLAASAATVFRASFGTTRWPIVLLATASTVLWPLLVFRGQLRFDPVSFTEEWIKTSVTGVLLVFALEILATRRREADAQQKALDTVTVHFLIPLFEVRQRLTTILSSPSNLVDGRPSPISVLHEQLTLLRSGYVTCRQLLIDSPYMLQNVQRSVTILDLESTGKCILALKSRPKDLASLHADLSSAKERVTRALDVLAATAGRHSTC